MEFVVQYAQLLAAVFSVEVPEDTGELLGLTRQVAAAVEPEPFVFRKKAVETDTSIKEKKKEPSVDGNRLMEILNEVSFSSSFCVVLLFCVHYLDIGCSRSLCKNYFVLFAAFS